MLQSGPDKECEVRKEIAAKLLEASDEALDLDQPHTDLAKKCKRLFSAASWRSPGTLANALRSCSSSFCIGGPRPLSTHKRLKG